MRRLLFTDSEEPHGVAAGHAEGPATNVAPKNHRFVDHVIGSGRVLTVTYKHDVKGIALSAVHPGDPGVWCKARFIYRDVYVTVSGASEALAERWQASQG